MKTLSIVVVLMLGFVQMASGQVHGFGFVQGRIVDEKGAPVANATFTAMLPRMGEHRTGSSNEKGEWRIVGLAQGEWDITFEKRGYTKGRARVALENQLVRIPFMTIRMKPQL